MKTVWKFPLTHEHQQTIHVPPKRSFLHAGYQRGTLCVWYEVDDHDDGEPLTIEIVGTGHSVHHEGTFLATVMTPQTEQWVWHLYEVPS